MKTAIRWTTVTEEKAICLIQVIHELKQFRIRKPLKPTNVFVIVEELVESIRKRSIQVVEAP